MANPAYLPDSGDIIWLVLDPRTGREQSGRRPNLVLSSPGIHETHSLFVPSLQRLKAYGTFEIPLEDTKIDGAILPIHVRSLNVEARHAEFIETLPPAYEEPKLCLRYRRSR